MRIIKTKEGLELEAVVILKGAEIVNAHGKKATYVMSVNNSLILYTEYKKKDKVINSFITKIADNCNILEKEVDKHRKLHVTSPNVECSNTETELEIELKAKVEYLESILHPEDYDEDYDEDCD